MSSVLFDLFATLTKGARAALPFLRAAAETEKTVTEILEEASTLGFKFRRQAGLDIIGALRNNVTIARAARIGNPEQLLPLALHGNSATKLLRNFSYTVKHVLRDKETGERKSIFTTVSSSNRLSKSQVIGRTEGFPLNQYGEGEFTLESSDVVEALKSNDVADDGEPYDPLGGIIPGRSV